MPKDQVRKSVAAKCETYDAVVKKLHPSRFTEMSPKMAAIVGCILGQKWTTPALAEIVVTQPGGLLLGRLDGDVGYNEVLGSHEDLCRNWNKLREVAELTEEESAFAGELFGRTVRFV